MLHKAWKTYFLVDCSMQSMIYFLFLTRYINVLVNNETLHAKIC